MTMVGGGRPSALGRFLRYFSSARAYAQVAPEKARPRSFETSFLAQMSAAAAHSGGGGTIDSDDAERLAITSYAYYAAIRTVTSRLASDEARPTAGKRGAKGWEEDKTHPFNDLLDNPNDLMDYPFIIEYLIGWLMLRGNAYLFVSTDRVGAGEPQELWPLEANKVTPIKGSLRRSRTTGRVTGDYAMDIGGVLKKMPGENIIHLRLPNFWDYWEGMSPLSAALQAVRTDKYQSDWLQGFFGRDNAIPTAIISLPPDISKEDYDAAKEAIREQFGEGRSSAVIRAGDMSVESVSQTIKEMEMLVGRTFSADEIFDVLGTPRGIVTGEIKGDDLHALQLAFAKNTIQPYVSKLAAAYTSGLRPFYGDGWKAIAPNVVPQDRALLVQEYQQFSMDKTINENRETLGLPPLEGAINSKIVVRVLRHVAAPGAMEMMEQRIGTLTGAEHPTQMANRITEDGIDEPDEVASTTDSVASDAEDAEDEKALSGAVASERKKWKKVALAEIEKGRRPEERAFVSALISEEERGRILAGLAGAQSADDVKAVFAMETE